MVIETKTQEHLEALARATKPCLVCAREKQHGAPCQCAEVPDSADRVACRGDGRVVAFPSCRQPCRLCKGKREFQVRNVGFQPCQMCTDGTEPVEHLCIGPALEDAKAMGWSYELAIMPEWNRPGARIHTGRRDGSRGNLAPWNDWVNADDADAAVACALAQAAVKAGLVDCAHLSVHTHIVEEIPVEGYGWVRVCGRGFREHITGG